MKQVKITLLSREPHLSQILTGFTMLARKKKLKLIVEDRSQDESQPYRSVMALVSYRGKTLVYDTLDGYQHDDAIRYHLENCDFYFKRSFSVEKNDALGLSWREKMFPLGFNYHVSCRNHPIDKPFWKEELKHLLGIEHNMFSCTYFSCRRFEQRPKTRKIPQVLFLTRLWHEDPKMPPHLLQERKQINQTRIEIIRRLRDMEGTIHFVGGLPDTDLAKSMAPDLIMPASLTERKKYLKCLRKSDICIGSMGLHESIGWKTGEYVAAAKAIVNETLHYQVPGNYQEGIHYLGFETAEQCIQAVNKLINHPHKLHEMKCANYAYYMHFLKPDILVKNTMDIVDRIAEL